MAKKNTWVSVTTMKVLSPPPNNIVVLTVVKDGKPLGQLTSEGMSEADAKEMASMINDRMKS